jgi:hypothetical protein
MRTEHGPGALAGATEAGDRVAGHLPDTKTGRPSQASEVVQRRRPTRAPRSKADPRNKTFREVGKAFRAWLEGKSWVPHTAELLASPAWRYRSSNAVKFINLLELEHAQHNGRENGFLKLTWRQMRKAGIGSDYIADTIAELEATGLVTVTHRGSYAGGARNNPSTYQLNYLPWKLVPATGAPVYYTPTDEWARYEGKSARPKSRRMNTALGPFRPTQRDQIVKVKIMPFPTQALKSRIP